MAGNTSLSRGSSSTSITHGVTSLTRGPHPSVTVVVPTLNEEQNLSHVLPAIPSWVSEVIIVDGHSTDATVAEAQRLLPSARIIMEERRGKGAALRAGFKAATGDIIVAIDADGSMDPAEIPLYVGGLMAGADLVKGTRFSQGAGTTDMGLLRRSGNWVLTRLVRVAHGGQFSDLCYGYLAFWRSVLDRLDLDCDGFEIETLIEIRALRRGLRIYELPSFEARRIHGRSNLRTFPDGWRVLRTITRETRSPVTSSRRHQPGATPGFLVAMPPPHDERGWRTPPDDADPGYALVENG